MAQITLNSSGVASSGSLLLQTNGTTTQATVDTSGNLGLGVTPSTWDSTYKALQVGSRSMFYGIGSEANMANNAYYNAGYKYVASSAAGLYTIDANVHKWYNAASGTAGNAITFTQAMTLDASGNLGLGTTSPTSYGSTYSVFEVAGSASGVINVKSGSTLYGQISNGTNLFKLDAVGASSSLLFLTNTTERARIDSSGRLLVNTTTNTTGADCFAEIYGGSDVKSGLNIRASGSSGTRYLESFFVGTNTNVGAITTNGTTTTYSTSSDYRLKNITGSLTGYKERLSALQPKQGSWKVDSSEFRGFLAHEFAESYPSSVNGQKDAVDINGNPQYQGMQAGSSEVIADLVAYIKELETRLSALEQA